MKRCIAIVATVLIIVSCFLLVDVNKQPKTISEFCSSTNDIYSQQECSIYKRKVIECGIEPRGQTWYKMCMADLMMTKYNIENCMR
jgi:hypothetical protein